MIFQAIENVCINFFSFFLLAQFPTYFTYLHLHIRFVRPIDLFFSFTFSSSSSSSFSSSSSSFISNSIRHRSTG